MLFVVNNVYNEGCVNNATNMELYTTYGTNLVLRYAGKVEIKRQKACVSVKTCNFCL